ncbi:hypothetical protein EU96_0994 [Prochlorococcus marinus str. MIT 9302]|uniref:Uncharacterized protein n=1 Tax=Prochlorococcus marinus str. MIT 9302 TaxID=74545 RepID=A0A0A2AA29_PROMR|nr:hypothetical protein EU96_0994 [Prochlorococcus marinus str. MIT 9302]
MQSVSKNYLVPIKFLPWIFWVIISLASIYLFKTAWVS